MGTSEVIVVGQWHEALNANDIDRLVSLSSDDIEIGGPRGSARGADVLREWVGRAGIRLNPGRTFHRAAIVVVEQSAQWRSAETGEITGSQTPATVFGVRDGRVAYLYRHPDLLTALQAAGLDESDEVHQT